MGRSQVLYNRTKGRYRQRNGAPGRGLTGAPPRVSNESPHENNIPPPQPAFNTAKSRRPKIDESVLLAEPTSMYVTHQEGFDDDIVFASGGMIDIANLAATLTSSMSLAQQLRIPSHVAYQLQRPNDMQELKSVKSKNEMSVETSNDDASFSVAQTRLRVDADGQVEARPKPGLYGPLVLVESIKEDEYIEDSSLHQDTHEQSRTMGALRPIHSENHESVPTFDDSVEPESRRIRHGNEFDEDDDDEDDDDESHGRDRYMALIESNLDDSDEFYGETSLDQLPPPTGTTPKNHTFEAGHAPASSRPEFPAPYSVPQVQSPREATQSSSEKSAKRKPKIDTSIGNIQRAAMVQPSAPTPKHSNNNQGSISRSNRPNESESYLEGWLEEALESEEAPLPIHQISVRPVVDNHDDYSSITDLPHHGGSSISSITFSKVGTRTTDKTPHYTRNRIHNDDDRRFSLLGGITSSGSSGGGSTMDSRGQVYEDDGSVQPLTATRKHQPSPHAKTKPSSSKTKVEAGGDDLDAWLDSVIA